MADAGKHKRDLSDYLGKHRKQQKQGYSSPNKRAESSSQPSGMPDLQALRIKEDSPKPQSAGKSNQVSSRAKRSVQVQSGETAKGQEKGARQRLAPKFRPSVKISGRKATINDLPTELLLHLLSFLPPNVLLICACVNREWLALASDNVLWQPLYEQYASQPQAKSKSAPKAASTKEKEKTAKPHPVYSLHADVKWKKACIKECISKRNVRLTTLLKKKDPYSFLPANTIKTIQKLGIKWELVLIDANKTEHSFVHSDAFHHHTSSSVRWYSLDPPPVRSLRRLAIYALAPVFFNKDGSAFKDSPCQRALMLDQQIKTSQLTGDPAIPSDAVNIYTLHGGIIIATWKEGGEIAFVSLCIHHHNILQRATRGTSERAHIPTPIKPRPDDIDPEYGMHDYSCILELRHQRTVAWSQQFQRLHSNKHEHVDGFVRLTAVRGDVVTDHSYTTAKQHFPWKTDVFKGIIKDFAIMDCTLYDEFQQPMWCISSPVTVIPDDKAPVTMEYDGDPRVIKYKDLKGELEVRMFWIPDREQHIVVAVNIDIAVKTVNEWFGTHY